MGVVQERIVIVEDVPLGDGVVAVVGSEFYQCPIGDVFASVGAVLIVGVEGEALRIACEGEHPLTALSSNSEKTFYFQER